METEIFEDFVFASGAKVVEMCAKFLYTYLFALVTLLQ